MYRKFVFLVIFDHFHFHNPLKSPLYQQQSTSKGSYSPKSLHKLILAETVFISYFYEVEMYLMYPEVVYLVFLVILSPLLTHSKSLYTTNEVHLKAHILPKVSISQFYQKLYQFLSFMKWKFAKFTQRSYFWPFSRKLSVSKRRSSKSIKNTLKLISGVAPRFK